MMNNTVKDLQETVRNIKVGRKYDKELVSITLATLEEAGADLSPTGLKKIDEVLYQRSRQYFGDYDTALVECTRKGLAHKKGGVHSRDHFFATIVEFARNDDDLRARNVQVKCTRASNMVYVSRIFPDWKTAIEHVRRRLLKEGNNELAEKFDWNRIQSRNVEAARQNGIRRRRKKKHLETLVEIHSKRIYQKNDIERIIKVDDEDSSDNIPDILNGRDLVDLMKENGWMTTFIAARYYGSHTTTLHKFARRDFPQFFRRYIHGKRRDFLVHPLLFNHYEKKENSNLLREDFPKLLGRIDPDKTYCANDLSKITGFTQQFFFKPVRSGEISSKKRGNVFLFKGIDIIDYFRRMYEEFNKFITLSRAARIIGTVPSRLIRFAAKEKINILERRVNGDLQFVITSDEVKRLETLVEEERILNKNTLSVIDIISETKFSARIIKELAEKGFIKAFRDPFDEYWRMPQESLEALRHLRLQITDYCRNLADRVDKVWLSHKEIWERGLPFEAIEYAARIGFITREKRDVWIYSGEDIKQYLIEEYIPYGKIIRARVHGLPVNHLVSYELARLIGQTGCSTRKLMHEIEKLSAEPRHQMLFANKRIISHQLAIPLLILLNKYDEIDERLLKSNLDNADVPKGKRILTRTKELCNISMRRQLDEQEEFDLMLCYNYISVAQAVGDISEHEALIAREETEVAILHRYLPIGIKLSRRYLFMADEDDRRSEIMFGLLGATRRFGDRDYRFLFYAWSSVKGHLISVFRNYQKMPLDSQGLIYRLRLREAYFELITHGENPTIEDIAQKAKVPYEYAFGILRVCQNIFSQPQVSKPTSQVKTLSLDSQIASDGKTMLYFVADESTISPEEEVIKQERILQVQSIIKQLSPMKREIAYASFIEQDELYETKVRNRFRLSEESYAREKENLLSELRIILADDE